MENEVQGQQVLFYTEEEVAAKITEVTKNLTETYECELDFKLRAYKNVTRENALEAVRGMRDEVDEESLVSMYNTIAEAVGWDTIDALTKTYTVTVSYKGYEVATFTEVEAESDGEACDKVLEDMDISDFNISIELTYGNNSESGEVSLGSWDIDTDDFEAEATEE